MATKNKYRTAWLLFNTLLCVGNLSFPYYLCSDKSYQPFSQAELRCSLISDPFTIKSVPEKNMDRHRTSAENETFHCYRIDGRRAAGYYIIDSCFNDLPG